MTRLVFSLFGLLLLSVAVTHASAFQSSENVFNRDVVGEAFKNWSDTYQATFKETSATTSHAYGTTERRVFDTQNGIRVLLFHLDTAGSIFDIGVDIFENNPTEDLTSRRVAQRLLWSLELSDTSIIRSFWTANQKDIQVRTGSIIGDMNDVMKTIGQMRNRTINSGQISLTNEEGRYTLAVQLDGDQFDFLFRPSLFLYLNGQMDVTYKTFLAMVRGETAFSFATEVSEIHQFQQSRDQFSVNVLSRSADWDKLTFVKSGQDWISENLDIPSKENLNEWMVAYWSTQHLPQGYRVNIPVAQNTMKFNVVLEGAELISVTEVPQYIHENLGSFGSGMTAYVESELRENANGNLQSVTYILYDHPELGYQHFFRVTDSFTQRGNELHWEVSNMHSVVGIRLDNLDSIFDEAGIGDDIIKRFQFKSNN